MIHPSLSSPQDSLNTATQHDSVDLTVSERLVLRGAAHALKPTVMVGKTGITPAVLAEAQHALAAHQLIKVKLLTDDREERAAAKDIMCASLGCHWVQTIGKVMVLFKDDGNYVPPAPGSMQAKKPSNTNKAKSGSHVPKKRLSAH